MKSTTKVAMPTYKQVVAQLIPIGKRLPAYVKLSWALAFEPTIPVVHRAWLYATVVYIVSPAHFVMNVVPIIGQIDWILLLMFSIRQAINHCPQPVLSKLYRSVKLHPEQLHVDISTLSRLCHDSTSAACASIETKAPMVKEMGKQITFAGRVAGGLTRRVVYRVRSQTA